MHPAKEITHSVPFPASRHSYTKSSWQQHVQTVMLPFVQELERLYLKFHNQKSNNKNPTPSGSKQDSYNTVLMHRTTVKYSSRLLAWKHLSKKMLHLHKFKQTMKKSSNLSISFPVHSAERRQQKSCHLPHSCQWKTRKIFCVRSHYLGCTSIS